MPAAAAPGVGGSQRGYSLPRAKAAPKPAASVGPPILPAPRSGRATTRATQAAKSAAFAYKPPKGAKYSPAALNGYGIASASLQRQQAQERLMLQRLLRDEANARVSEAYGSAGLIPHSHSDGGLLGFIEGAPIVGSAIHLGEGAVHSAASIAPTIGKLLVNTGKDALSLPKSTLQGIEGIGSATIDDLLHGRLGNQNFGLNSLPGHQSEVATLANNAWRQSVIGHLANADLKGAWKTFEQHPLYGASEFAGAYGLLGRAAGAVARSGALGSDLAAAASTARAARELAPGIEGDVQHYSHNLLTKKAQQALEQHPKLHEAIRTAAGRSTTRMLNKRVDEHVATAGAREQAMTQATGKVLHKEMPKGAAAGVTPYAVQGIAGPQDRFLQGLEQHAINLKAAEAAHHSAVAKGISEGRMSPKGLANNQINQANIAAFLKNPDVAGAFNTTYVPRRIAIDEALAKLGLRDPAEMERRTLMPYATTQMQGVHLLPDNAIPTARALDARQALRDVGMSKKALVDAQKNQIKLNNMHGTAEQQALAAERSLSQAAKQEARTRGFLTGRYGQQRVQAYEDTVPGETPQPLPGEAGTRLDRGTLGSYTAKSDLSSMRDALKAARQERRQVGQDAIDASKENLKASREEFAKVHKPYLHEKHGGLMVEDPNAPLLRSGKYKGMRLRRLTNEEVKAHMAQQGMDPVAYVRLNTPTESSNIIPGFLRRGGSKSKRFTGASIAKGTSTPGYGALAKTEINSTRQLARAMSHDEFIKESAVKDASGSPLYVNKVNGPQTAAQYEQHTGVKVDLVPAHPQGIGQLQKAAVDASQGGTTAEDALLAKVDPKENLVMIPRTMVQRYLKHQDVLNSGNKFLMGVNRQFRNTVLPLSPKWLTGNFVEAAGRSALRGAGPGDFRLAGQVIKRMREMGLNDQADHLERMATGGLHYGMQHRLNMEQIGATEPGDAGMLVRSARQAGKLYTHFAQAVFNVNRHMESSIEKTVLGTHMHHQMQEFTGTWAQAISHQKDYVDRLAQGYADPRMAADAGRYIHDVLGQYDRFSPGMKRFVRSIAPFAPWYINALKFVYHTLPHQHPVAQSILLDANRPIQEQWAKDHNVPHDNFLGQPTGDLLSALRVGPSDYLNLGRYTPMGAFTSGPIDYGMNMLLPQGQGFLRATIGQDPFGNDLAGPNGKLTDTGKRFLVGVNDILGELGGPLNTLDRVVMQHGDTAYNTSTLWDTQLKPNTHHGGSGVLGGFQRVFNPLEPTHLGKVGGGKGAKVIGPGASVGGSGAKVVGPGVK